MSGADTPWGVAMQHRVRIPAVAATLAATLASGTIVVLTWRRRRGRELRRPFVIRDIAAGETLQNPQVELTNVIEWLQDAIVRPLDERLPGRPFAYDLLAFPFTPLVLVIGNHSAGKSTFINRLLGLHIQETGVAPTDDGFTVLQRHPSSNEVEDGPTLISDAENPHFKELQRFGPAFWCHLKRKLLKLPNDSEMPYDLQIVDTPGMIDMPVKSEALSGGGRGYSFLEVVRWFAQRADLVLLLFDPDRPGTTGESLDVLTQSLAGLDHKFLIVLNKVDQLDSSVDFARAYGTLGWALSKVIPRKDIPQIYTMYNAGVDKTDHTDSRHSKNHLPLEPFRRKREEVVAEVLRAKVRHWDNVITTTEETLRQLAMVATVSAAIRLRVRARVLEVQAYATAAILAPGLAGGVALHRKWTGTRWAFTGYWTAFALVCFGAGRFLWEYCTQFENLQLRNIDEHFLEAHEEHFIHVDAEDLRARWSKVRPRTLSVLRAARGVAAMPVIAPWEVTRIHECLEKDVLYLRRIAKLLRTPDGKASST